MERSVALFLLFLVGATTARGQNPSVPASSEDVQAQSEPYPERVYTRKDGPITPPKALYSPDPKHPKVPRGMQKHGTVVLWLIVGSDGLPYNICVQRSLNTVLDDAAVDALKKWKFAPATKDAKAVAVQINVEMVFP